MDTPTQDVKHEMDFSYAVDQQVSVNAFIDIDINGELVRFQITSRYNSTAAKIVKTTEEAISAFSMLRAMFPRPAAPQPAPKPAPASAQPSEESASNPAGTSFKVSKIKVTPEIKDGVSRIMVELFAEGHQWADIKKFFNTAEEAAVAFSDVTQLNFNVAGEYSINCFADYRLSDKKNSKGNPYKNLVRVRLS